MSKKATVTEKLREELRDRVMALTPGCRWHVIARRERELVTEAFLRIDKEGHAEVLSDDAVSATIYHQNVGRQLTAKRDLEWLEEHNLWTGATLHPAEPELIKEAMKKEDKGWGARE